MLSLPSPPLSLLLALPPSPPFLVGEGWWRCMSERAGCGAASQAGKRRSSLRTPCPLPLPPWLPKLLLLLLPGAGAEVMCVEDGGMLFWWCCG